MDVNQANQLLALYGNRLPFESMEMVRNKLLNISLGVDRFYIGDVGLGVGKLLTCGGAYVWWLIDIFMIQDATKRKNMEMLMMY